MGAASCGLAVNSLHSPCAPLLPVWGVDRARHIVPPPLGRLALPSPLTDTRCTHVRAGLLLLLAVVRPTTGSLLPSPPRCLQRKYARRAARHHKQLGGRWAGGKNFIGSVLRP